MILTNERHAEHPFACQNTQHKTHIQKPIFFIQGSRWTFQATRMNGDTFGWQILPDQMQVYFLFFFIFFNVDCSIVEPSLFWPSTVYISLITISIHIIFIRYIACTIHTDKTELTRSPSVPATDHFVPIVRCTHTEIYCSWRNHQYGYRLEADQKWSQNGDLNPVPPGGKQPLCHLCHQAPIQMQVYWNQTRSISKKIWTSVWNTKKHDA